MQVDKVVKDMMRTEAREACREELDILGKDMPVLMAEMIQLGLVIGVANDKGALHPLTRQREPAASAQSRDTARDKAGD